MGKEKYLYLSLSSSFPLSLFVDYLWRCRSYGVTKDDPPPLSLPPQDRALLELGPGGRSNRETFVITSDIFRVSESTRYTVALW